MFLAGFGTILFGLAIGWMVYRVLRHGTGMAVLAHLVAVLGIIGGAIALALFRDEALFGWYAIGFVLGFFAHFTLGLVLYGKQEVQAWQIAPPAPTPVSPSSPDPETSNIA
jgi:hypothetical protein